jgi:hypothetical protein
VSAAAVPLLALVLGAGVVVLGILAIRASGANTGAGRRLAGAPAISLRELHERVDRGSPPRTAVRVEGRVRCRDPLTDEHGNPLALVHRDVEVQDATGRWRTVERLRDARGIDLWERSTSVPLDLSDVAEPLIAIPRVWEGTTADLPSALQPAVQRLLASGGQPAAARSTTRQVMLVDHLIVLAEASRDPSGALRLDPPPGGFLVSTVELDVAMRLLAGPHRRRMLAGYAIGLLGALIVIGAAIALGLTLAA